MTKATSDAAMFYDNIKALVFPMTEPAYAHATQDVWDHAAGNRTMAIAIQRMSPAGSVLESLRREMADAAGILPDGPAHSRSQARRELRKLGIR